MIKLLKFNWFWFFFATCLILFSFTIFSNWVLMVFIWFGLFFTFRFTQLESKLSAKEHKLYLITVLLYPLVETWIKWMIEKNVIPNSWSWLNRLEHFSWAVVMVIIFLPVFKEIYQSLKGWQNLIFVIGFICLIGNLNEFLEYFLRVPANLLTVGRYIGEIKNPWPFAIYYCDTIYDMMMNIMGGFVGFLVLKWNTKLP